MEQGDCKSLPPACRGNVMSLRVPLVISVLSFSTTWAVAQTPNDPPPGARPEAQAGQDRQRRRGGRDRLDRYQNASPQEQDQLRADGYVRRLTGVYKLSDDQQKVVRDEI